MKKFVNKTDAGNENAIRKGKRVPDDAVNLAWVSSPGLNPGDNLAIIDTSSIYSENSIDSLEEKKLMFANQMGVLEDWDGNQLIDDEYPTVSDVFSVDEDYSMVPGSEYTVPSILGYVHRSRFFHIDYASLTLGTELLTVRNDAVKVVNNKGEDYVDSHGKPRYRIKLTPASVTIPGSQREALYRVYAYVDTALNEELYLKYNMVELDADNAIARQQSNFKETLNPQKYFKYNPEESEVLDPSYRTKKQYSTQPINKKEQTIGKPVQSVDGYKVYVPKKAIEDTRQFQLFRWRLGCTFTERYKVDPIRRPQVINVGVVVTNNRPQSNCPYVFYNLEKSEYNPSNLKFENPLREVHSDDQKRRRIYWQVNMDTVSNDELKKFDLLIWSVQVPNYNMGPYLGKLLHFTGNLGGTVFFDSNNAGRINGLGTVATQPVDPATGWPKVTTGPPYGHAKGMSMKLVKSDALVQGQKPLGGWDLYDNSGTAELYSISPYRRNWNHGGIGKGFVQRVYSRESHWWTVVSAPDENDISRPLIQRCKANSGNYIYSTIGMPDNVSNLQHQSDGRLVHKNTGPTIVSDPNYLKYINGHLVEGAYKFMYNVALLAVAGKPLDSSDEKPYSSSWNHYTPWNASWVIDPSEGVLSEKDIKDNDFVRMQESATSSVPLWKRKLSGKTAKALIDEQLAKNPELARKVLGASRTYFLECSNPAVLTTPETEIKDNTLAYAWTKEKSPPFNIPAELGAHVVRQDNVIGDYTSGNYMHKSYPEKPYRVQVFANNVTTEQQHTPKTGTWTATATITVNRTSTASSTESILNWYEDGVGSMAVGGRPHEVNLPVPGGLVTWQDGNYYSSKWGPGNLNWPYWGMNQRLTKGSQGEIVGFLHDALNRLFNSPTGKFAADDTYFGTKTVAAVKAFQQTYGARFVDGVVDAETWFLIGNRIMVFYNSSVINVPPKYEKYYRMPRPNSNKFNVSNGSTEDQFMKRSSIIDSPPVIWELFKIQLEAIHNIHGITITPWVGSSATKSIMLRSIDVRKGTVPMKDYDSRSGKLIEMPFRPVHGKPFYLPFGPYKGDNVIVGIGQDGPSGIGKSRILGVKDIQIHARGSKGNGKAEVVTQTITVTGPINFPTIGDYFKTLTHNYKGPGKVVDITWTSLTVDNPDISGTILNAKKGTVVFNSFVINNPQNAAKPTKGPFVPAYGNNPPAYRSMNENKVLNPGLETGRISKNDGIKLLCKADKTPYGFPTLVLGTNVNENQIHYTTLTINSIETDKSIQLGFYDVKAKEFIRNATGHAEISYGEYLKRGPSNIYIGMISDFEVTEQVPFPAVSDAPLVPYRWAMPVYGLTFRKGSAIQIEKPSPNLDFFDLWSLPIRTGNFIRKVQIPRRSQQVITGFYSAYQGATLEAYYEVAEADTIAWSTLHGRPFRDIKDENPLILDDRTIQVKQSPIHAVVAPTQDAGLADPLRPVFKVFKRAGLGHGWEQIPLSQIKDYNLSTGVIELKGRLSSLDPELVKVSYTTDRPVYYYKGTKDNPLVLNPYLTESYELLERPIYIGITPRYVKYIGSGSSSDDAMIIPESVTSSTLSWTTDISSKLDPSSPSYDPFYVQLGIVYVSPSASMAKLAIVDSRRRGGGLETQTVLKDVQKTIAESKHYWDISYGSGLPYQASGFVIVRLPVGLKQYFTKEQITAIIEKNITAGVQFKIEDLDGGEW